MPSAWRPREPFAQSTDPLGRLRGISGGLLLTARPSTRLAEGAALLRSLAEWSRRSATSLNGPIGPHRRWSWAEAGLDDVKTIRQGLGGTVNDVVLAAITAGFRSLLLHRGEDVSNRVVRTLVPVSVRADSERGTYNNRVSGIFPGLPVSIADPAERLNVIAAQLSMLKGSKQAVAGDALVKLAGFAPPMLLSVGARLAARTPQRALQTVTTNVPGPQYPLYVVGRRMVYSYPYVPIMGSVRVSIAIFSYCGRLFFGITGDYDTVTDIDVLRDGIEEGMRELVAAAGGANGSGRTQTRDAIAAELTRAVLRTVRRRFAPGKGDGRSAGGRNGCHTPSGCASRSAITQSTEALCPMPRWLLYTATFSRCAPGVLMQACHGTTPSRREYTAVVGTGIGRASRSRRGSEPGLTWRTPRRR